MDAQQIKHFARLARIGVTDTEAESLAKDVSRILEFVDTLQKIVPDQSYLSAINHTHIDNNNVREDVPVDSDSAAAVVDAFPKSVKGMLKVPKVL